MNFTISQKELAMLQEKSKLFNYLSSSFTKTYFALGAGKFTVFFRGAKGALKFSFDIESKEAVKVFQIDYTKWLNAIAKLSFADEISLSLTEKSLRISVQNSSDLISLGIISYAADSSEASVLESFVETFATMPNKLSLTQDIADALIATSSMFSSAGHNNAVALNSNSVLYADRSIVLEANFPTAISFIAKAAIELHKYSAGFMLQAMKFSSDFFFSEDGLTLYWISDDKSTSVALVSEVCEIAIPTIEELDSIRPTASDGSFEIDHRELFNALEFFNGFYEASVWKPITFDIGLDETRLHYKHPTTEISKELKIAPTAKGTFAIGSENLSKLLSLSIDSSGSSERNVYFRYSTDAAGVRCIIGDAFDVTFAKLIS